MYSYKRPDVCQPADDYERDIFDKFHIRPRATGPVHVVCAWIGDRQILAKADAPARWVPKMLNRATGAVECDDSPA